MSRLRLVPPPRDRMRVAPAESLCTPTPPTPALILQRELHELASGHGPEFVLADHLPPVPGQQPGEQDGAAAAAAAGGPVPMAE